MENKERALKAAFPIPDSNTCSFASPSPGPDVLPSLLYLRTAQVASPCYSTLLRQHEEKQQQEQPPCPHSPWRCSAAPWGGHAEPWDLQRSPLTGEWFSLRCSAASAGMCKQTVCRPINHSPPGSFS